MDRSNLHYFGYVFVGFAHLSDKLFSEEEHRKIIELVNEWAVDSNYTNASFAITMAEIMMWYEEISDFDKKKEMLIQNIEYLADQDWFKPDMKEKFVRHLWELAASDGIVEEEKNLIGLMSEKWNVQPLSEL